MLVQLQTASDLPVLSLSLIWLSPWSMLKCCFDLQAQETPLHIAARIKEGEKCAEMLVKSGADVNATKEVISH